MAKAPTTTNDGDKPKRRAVNPDVHIYLVGPPDAIAQIAGVERDAQRVLDMQNEAAERGESVVSKRFTLKRKRRGNGSPDAATS